MSILRGAVRGAVRSVSRSLPTAFFDVGNLINSIKGGMPKLEESADITVYGNPNAKRGDLYWLATAIAFGLIKRRDLVRIGPPAGLIMMEYNVELNRVRFVVQQNTSWMPSLLIPGTDRAKHIQLFHGPADIVRGGAWQWNAAGIPNFPGKIIGDKGGWDIVTGWEGKEIITPNPAYVHLDGNLKVSESPPPPGDSISRGTPTLAANPTVRALRPDAWYTNPEYLLFNALSEPCQPKGFYETDLKSTDRIPYPPPVPPDDKVPPSSSDIEIGPPPRPIFDTELNTTGTNPAELNTDGSGYPTTPPSPY